MNWSSIVNSIKTFTDAHAPEIFVGSGIAAAGLACFLTAKETPKAIQAKEALKRKWAEEDKKSNTPPTFKTKLKRAGEFAWTFIKSYKWAALAYLSSVTLLLSGTNISLKRTAAASTAYTVTQEAFDAYKHKVVEQIGENKEKKISDEVDKDEVSRQPVPMDLSPISGKRLCYDYFLKKYFYSTTEEILKAETAIVERLMIETFVSLNDYLYMVDMPNMDELGEKYGWMADKKPEIHFSSQLAPNGEPALVVHYDIYDKFA